MSKTPHRNLISQIDNRDSKEVMRILGAGNIELDIIFERTTPLMRAITRSKMRIVELLLKAGANTNIIIGQGAFVRNAISEAARIDDLEIFTLLLHYGASPDSRSLRYSVEVGQESLKNLITLTKKYSATWQNIFTEGQEDRMSQIGDLITLVHKEKAIPISALFNMGTSNQGDSPTHLAATCKDVDALQYIILMGGRISNKNSLGQTPVDYILTIENENLRNLLLKSTIKIIDRSAIETPLSQLTDLPSDISKIISRYLIANSPEEDLLELKTGNLASLQKVMSRASSTKSEAISPTIGVYTSWQDMPFFQDLESDSKLKATQTKQESLETIEENASNQRSPLLDITDRTDSNSENINTLEIGSEQDDKHSTDPHLPKQGSRQNRLPSPSTRISASSAAPIKTPLKTNLPPQ